MLVVEGLVKRFGTRTVLDGLGLHIAAGEYVAIVGESGSGKSTLLNLIAGLERPDAGSVMIDGANIASMNDEQRTLTRRAKVGFVFQSFHILPHLTVAQNVELPLVLLDVSPIARAVVHRPALVLADEPTGNLDPDTADTVLKRLAHEIRSRGAGGVLVTHSQVAALSADRMLVLDHGRLRPRD